MKRFPIRRNISTFCPVHPFPISSDDSSPPSVCLVRVQSEAKDLNDCAESRDDVGLAHVSEGGLTIADGVTSMKITMPES